MKKALSLLLAVLMVLSLAGVASAAAPTTTITVFCAYASEDPHGPYVYKYAEAFMAAHPEVKVEVTAVSSNDIFTKVSAMANDPDALPTLIYTSADQAASLHDLGLLEDFSKYLDASVPEGFAPGVVEGYTLDGTMAFFPIDIQPLAVLYRTDRFEEAGLQPPTSWDELLEASKKLTADTDGDGQDDQWGFGMVGSNNSSGQSRFMSYLWTQGFECVAQDESGKWITDMEGDAFVKAFSFWTDMNNVHKVVPTGITSVDYATAANYFAMGYTNTMMTGSNALGVAYNTNPDLKGKIGSFRIPGDKPGSMLNVEGYGLCAKATEDQKKAAAEFVQFFVSGDPEMNFWKLSGKIPATKGGLDSEYLQGADYAGYLDTIAKGTRPIMTFPGAAALKGALGDAFSAVFSGEKTNEQACADLHAAVTELLADYN